MTGTETPPVLVLGLGNPLSSDDGVGLAALEALASRVGSSPGIELLDGGTAGLGLVPRASTARRILVLDAVRAGETPGTVLKLDGRALRRDVRSTTSPHQMGLADVVSALAFLGDPAEVVVLGIEPETTALGVGLSEPVEAALSRLVREALVQLQSWGVVEATL